MGRKIELVCDKCGIAINPYHQKEMSAKIVLWGIGDYRYNEGQRIDFCDECFEKFIDMYDRFMAE